VPTDFSSLSPDEIIYVGKLLKILRSQNKSTAAAIKYSVDAFLKASELPVEQYDTEKEAAGKGR